MTIHRDVPSEFVGLLLACPKQARAILAAGKRLFQHRAEVTRALARGGKKAHKVLAIALELGYQDDRPPVTPLEDGSFRVLKADAQ